MATAPGPSVLSEIALQLSLASRVSGPPLEAMATLIGPTRALTAHNKVVGFPADQLFVVTPLSGGTGISARIVARDPSADLALLELSSPWPSASENVPIAESPRFSDRWMTYIRVPGMPEPLMLTGALTGVQRVLGVDHLRLEVHDHPSAATAAISGAPVIVEGTLVGIISRVGIGSEFWYAAMVTKDTLARLESSPADLSEPDVTSAPPASHASASPLAPFDADRFFQRLSPSSSTALRHADAMRRRSDQARVHMEHLVTGLFLKADGPADRLFSAHGIGSHEALRVVLSAAAEVRMPNPGEYTLGDSLAELPPVSVHVQEAFEHAQAIADRKESPQVQSRHLLYGVLSVQECSVVKVLIARGIVRDEIVLSGSAPPGVVGTPIIGADSDAPSGVDRLGLEQEIATLAALVATQDTNTPMSIGLFGNWGSGKSFFMQKMDEQIRQYRDVAANDPTSPYCSSIVQLWFNAWHYIDKSLWASLGAEIFEGLAHALTEIETKKDGRAQLDDARISLLIQREAAEAERKRAEAQLEQSTTKLTQHNATVERIRTATDREVEKSLKTPALVAEVLSVAAADPPVKAALDMASRNLGGEEIRQQSAHVEEQVKEILAIGTTWQFLAKSVRDGGAARWWIAAALMTGIAFLLVPTFPAVIAWLETPARRLLSALVAFSALMAPALVVARRVTAVIVKARDSLKARIEGERQRSLDNAVKAREPVLQEEAVRREAVEKSTQKVQQIDEQLAQLQPTRQFIDFIRERQRSTAYTQHFGVIARARQDFEELTRLMKLMREAPRDVQANANSLRPVDRIVLYIDDLDRCPEDKVFEVLQAVHLLLAFPLFVVVVGVDPRWLFHSLRTNLTAFSTQSAAAGSDDEEEKLRWQSTPLNYLEKIFQIPFTLRPMGDTGYEQLIDELTKPRQPPGHGTPRRDIGETPAEPAGHPVPNPTSAGVETSTEVVPTVPSAPGAASPTVAGDAGVDAVKPDAVTQAHAARRASQAHERLSLATWESGYMKLLFPLIPSPRAAKRFVNVYRLLRGVLPNNERVLLVGNETQGGYRAVLLLLAMVTGYPAEATIVIRVLLERVRKNGGSEGWWAALDAIRAADVERPPSPKSGRRSELKRGSQHDQKADRSPADDEGQRWDEMFASLDAVRKNAGGDLSARTMARWAPVVARYSFASGRLLVADRERGAEAVH